MNMDVNIFIKQQPTNINQRVERDIIFMMVNNHMYIITDPKLRKKYQLQTSVCVSNIFVNHTKQNEDDEEHNYKRDNLEILINPIDDITEIKNAIVYLDKPILDDVLMEFVNKKGVIVNDHIKCNNEGIKSIIYKHNNLILYANSSYRDCKHMADILEYDYKNESIMSMGKRYFTENYELPESSFSPEFEKIVNSKLFNTSPINNTYDTCDYTTEQAIDKKRFYKNCMYHNKYEYPIYSTFDEIKPYSSGYKCGYYYVETSNNLPFNGNGW
jgi:hypothetical protein